MDAFESLNVETQMIESWMQRALQEALPDVSEELLASSTSRIPTLEFDLEVDGEVVPVRFTVNRSTSRQRTEQATAQRPPRPPLSEKEQQQLASQHEQSRQAVSRQGVIAVTGEPSDRELSWRRYLLRLHTAHGYPVQQNARWFWAIVVDLMFASMEFWGLSGIVMWWQLKKTRRLGAVVAILSAIAAGWLAVSMHAEMMS